MANEKGGVADKLGNYYEYLVVIKYLLELFNGEYRSVTYEPHNGEIKEGVDITVVNNNGRINLIQCKNRNGDSNSWTFSSLEKADVSKYIFQYLNNPNLDFTLVSPVSSIALKDLLKKGRTYEKLDDFNESLSKNAKKEYDRFYASFEKYVNSDEDKCFSYLKRIYYREIVDDNIEKDLQTSISFLFIGDKEDNYRKLFERVSDGSIFRKEIDVFEFDRILKQCEIEKYDLINNEKILNTIDTLNSNYKKVFSAINDKLYSSYESEKCINSIIQGNSLIIKGKAGSGKSGCIENIINYCGDNHIPYLAIKLDRKQPKGNLLQWSNSLEFDFPLHVVIDRIHSNKDFVLILDQFDTLRWIQKMNPDSIDVIDELISNIRKINKDNKIHIVVACRDYDFHNDSTIKNIFKSDDSIKWEVIETSKLSEKRIKEIIGDEYTHLTDKQKEMLSYPSNLFIWLKLDESKRKNDINSTYELIHTWWKKISNDAIPLHISSNDIKSFKSKTVQYCIKYNRISIPIIELDNSNCIDYLISSNIIQNDNNVLYFCHQSIIDNFIAEDMLKHYFRNESLSEILGNKNDQTLMKRHQFKILLQQIRAINSENFIVSCKEMLESDNVRESYKYVFFELLAIEDEYDEHIANYIIENYSTLLETVINRNVVHIHTLRDKGILDELMDKKKYGVVADLFHSISSKADKEDVEFLRKYCFINENIDKDFKNIFIFSDFNEECDELFELRLEFYKRYYDLLNEWFYFKQCFIKNPIRTSRVLFLLTKGDIESNYNLSNNVNEGVENLFNHTFNIDYEKIIDILLPLIDYSTNRVYDNWSFNVNSDRDRNLERLCVDIIKFANSSVIKDNPNRFFEIYEKKYDSGKSTYNEIILDGLYQLDDSYSDYVIEYLSSNFESRYFVENSISNHMYFGNRVLEKFTKTCSSVNLRRIVDCIVNYKNKSIIEEYKLRRKYRKNDHVYTDYYLPYWGKEQFKLLRLIPSERLSKYNKDLLEVLKRRFSYVKETNEQQFNGAKFVDSPLKNKTISLKNWKSILENNDIANGHKTRYVSKTDSFIEYSAEGFARDYESFCETGDEGIIDYLIQTSYKINTLYIESAFYGLSRNKNINNISNRKYEQLILKYVDYKNYNLCQGICSIICNCSNTVWSKEILDVLCKISFGKCDDYVIDSKDSLNNLSTMSLNSFSGIAFRAIQTLVNNNTELCEYFDSILEKHVQSDNIIVQYSTLSYLYRIFKYNNKYVPIIFSLLNKNIALTINENIRYFIISNYESYKEESNKVVEKILESGNDGLVKIAGYLIADIYIYFKDDIKYIKMSIKNKSHKTCILKGLCIYLRNDEYKNKAKTAILDILSNDDDAKIFERCFYQNVLTIENDCEFIKRIMSLNNSYNILRSLIDFLEENEKNNFRVISDLILNICRSILANSKNIERYKISRISRMLFGLYNETYCLNSKSDRLIANTCLDVFDNMYKQKIFVFESMSTEEFCTIKDTLCS